MTDLKLDIIGLIFAGVGIFLSYIVYRWNRDPDNPFELKDLVMENGKASRLGVTWLGSFLVMSFGFIHMIIHNTLTDTYAATYAGVWAIPIVSRMFTQKPSDQSDGK